MRTSRASIVGLLALTLVAGGCSAGQDSSSTSNGTSTSSASALAGGDRTDYNPQPYEKLTDGGTFTSSGSFSGEDTQGNPFNVNSTLTAQRLWMMYNAKAITFSPDGEVQVNKDYYSSATQSTKDGKQVVTIAINPKAAFNDGTPVDWRALEATWKVGSGKVKGAQIGATTGWEQIESVTQGKDAREAVITFSKPYTGWPALFNTFLHPRAATADGVNKAYSNQLQPQWGVGPFTVESFDKNSRKLVFVRNPKWWGRTAKLDKRIYLDFANAQANVNAFKNGQVDYASASTAESLSQVKGVDGSEIRQGGSPFQYSLLLNGKSPVLSDVKVRHAVMAAVDREQIAKINFQGLDYTEPLPGSAVVYTFQKGYTDNLSKVLKPGAEEAGRILDEAGWKPGSDGIREKDGKRLTVKYTLFGSEPIAKAEAASLTAAGKKAGIEIKTVPTDPAQWATVINGNKFDMVISGYRNDNPYGVLNLSTFYGSTSPDNITRIGSAEVDKKIAEVNAMSDPKAQFDKANEVEVEAMKSYNILPMYSGPSTYAVRKDLANVGATLMYSPLPEEIGYTK